MARVNFRVTEVNDLTKDGSNTKRIVLEAAKNTFIETGPVSDPTDPKAFPSDATVTGRFELVVDNRSAAFYFPLGSIHAIDFAQAPAAEPVTAPKKAKRRAAKSKAKKGGRKK